MDTNETQNERPTEPFTQVSGSAGCAKCSKCKYSILEDNGYSNYTVEGTDIGCLKGLNPKFPVDAWYGECPEGEFAQTCPSFTEGESVSVDVEREDGRLEDYSDDPEIKELLRLRDAPPNDKMSGRGEETK